MIKRKRIRQKGKISLSRYFQEFDEGESVAIVRELAMQSPGFPKRMQGRTGKVLEKRGKAYVIEISDFNKQKKLIVNPIHLRRIK